MDRSTVIAFLLTLIAGLSTGIGSCIAFFAKHTNKTFLSLTLGFSAGVMIYVSMIEIYFKAQDKLVLEFGEKSGCWVTAIAFFAGIFFIALIDKIVPSEDSLHVNGMFDNNNKTEMESRKLKRLGIYNAIAIAIHNFPEGFTTFISALQEPKVAMPIVIAIAIHNIPEGIAVSVPIYQATGSRIKAFGYSFLSGVSEPVGALIGWLILGQIMDNVVYGIVFSAVAGIMVFISINQLLPAAREYGDHHLSMYGFISGMIVMAVSLLLFI